MITRSLILLIVAVCLAQTGCGPKLNVEKPFSLPGDDGPVHILIPDAQSRDQKVTVTLTVTGDGEPVDVFVIKKADIPDETEILNDAARKKMETAGLAAARNTKSATLTCTVPANTEYRVIVILDAKPGKKSQGTVKLTS